MSFLGFWNLIWPYVFGFLLALILIWFAFQRAKKYITDEKVLKKLSLAQSLATILLITGLAVVIGIFAATNLI